MNRKSIAQEYFALAADKNGNMPPMRRDESNAGLVAACFMDLLLNEIIAADKKKITVIREMPQELIHIESLYRYLNERPHSIERLMIDYYSGKRIKQLIEGVGESLLENGAAVTGNGGVFVSGTTYIPEKGYRDELINTIKSALSKDGEITSHDVALIIILQKTKNLNQYLSKHESNEMKDKLKEIKKNPQNKQLTEMIDYVSEMITFIFICYLVYSV